MKLKKILTILIFSVLSLTGVFFGCKDKYKDFKISVNGESEITLYSGGSQSDDYPKSQTVSINIENAPNNNCRILSYSVSQNNIVTVEELKSSSENVKQYLITALDNISVNRPTTVITFRSLEGNRECSLKVNVEIPIQSLTVSKNYTPYAVNDNKPYYIDISKAFNFMPANTTQRNIEFELVDETLKDYVSVSKEGAITISENYFDQEKVESTFQIKAKSADNEALQSVTLDVNVLRDITFDDITLSYVVDGVKNAFSGKVENDNSEIKSIDELISNGINLASNWDNRRNSEFLVEIKQTFGLTLQQINVGFERFSLTNALIEQMNNGDNRTAKFNIYSTNPGKDEMVLEISYKQVADYSKQIKIPLNVLEYPISLVVNNNVSKISYDIFDFYKTNSKGEEFNVVVEKSGAYDRTFKVGLTPEDFDLIEVYYLDEMLSFEDLTSRTFNSGTRLFIKAKDVTDETKPINIKFYSNILQKDNEGNLVVISENLVKEISLNLIPGIKSLNFDANFDNDKYYLDKDSKVGLEIPFVVNNGVTSLSNYVSLEIVKGANLVDIEKDGNSFVLKGKGICGDVEFYLKSNNGLETSTKKLFVYSGYKKDGEKFELILNSNNIKTVQQQNNNGTVELKYYIGTTFGKNNANFKISNPQKASIYNVVAQSNNEAINVAVLNKDELTFSLVATQNVDEPVTISVIIQVYKDFEEINNSNEIYDDIEINPLFEINTYKPLTSVTFKNGELSDSVSLIDGEALDIDSLDKKMNMLDIESMINLVGDTKNIKVKYNMPNYLIEDEYEAIYDNEGNKIGISNKVVEEHDYHRQKANGVFDKLYFHTAKNHKFVNNQLVFGITIEISDLDGSNEAYLLTLKVVLNLQVEPEEVVIKNENGYIYINNTDLDFAKIDAEVVGKNGKEATNKALSYEIKEGSSVSVDENGVLTAVSAGITKIRVYAKASKYSENGDYSKYADIYAIVADGSKSYPYLLTNENQILDDKYYCLANNIVLNQTITCSIEGLNGKNVYAKYSTALSENSVYNLIFNGTGSVFDKANEADIENLNIVYNQNQITINSDFGLIAKENKGTIKNVNLIINNLQINIEDTSDENFNVGLMFATNSGTIQNCSVASVANETASVVLNSVESETASVDLKGKKKSCNFGGLVAVNTGEIVGNFNFLSNNISGVINLKIVDNMIDNIVDDAAQKHILGGLVAQNSGTILGIKVDANITSTATIVGGLVGKFVSENNENKEYKNLYFSGNIIASNADFVGGIAGVVESKTSFNLVFAEFVDSADYLETSKAVGGLIGGIAENAETDIAFSYSKGFATNAEYNLKGNIVGGLVGETKAVLSLMAVYSDVKLALYNENSVGGAFVGNMNNDIEVENAYSYSTGSQSLIAKRESGKLTLNKVYSTTCSQKEQNGDEFKYFYDKTNYINAISQKYEESGKTDQFVFNDDKYFRYSSLENGGRPYLVYNEADGYKKLMTIVSTNINANLIVKNKVGSSGNYIYGATNDIIVVDDGVLNKAVIYYKNNLEFNISDIININVTPSDAIKDFIISSSNNEVISFVKNAFGQTLKINGKGNCVITISARHNQNIKTYVYFSVIDQIEKFTFEENITISNKSTKQIDYELTQKTTQNGVMFKMTENNDKILVNNMAFTENQIFCFDSRILITGLDVFEKTTSMTVAPFVVVRFGNEVYNFVDETKQKEIKINVVNNATVISSTVNYFAIPENETVRFEVFVDSGSSNQSLEFESLDGETLSEYFEFKVEKQEIDSTKNQTIFEVTVKANNVNLSNDKLFNIKISHKIGENINENIYETLRILLKSSKLKGVELNHYSSTVYYYNNYDFIINKETTPSFVITKGNLGVLSINLYPSFANIRDIEISSSIINGNRVNFSQLALTENNALTVVPHKANLYNGIKLKISKEEIEKNGGNIYVSTLLSSNVLDDTIFTITVSCYYGFGQKYEPVTLDLKAKALTTIILSNPNGSDNYYVPKGATTSFNINAINMDEDFKVDLSNFEFYVGENQLKLTDLKDASGLTYYVDPVGKSLFGFKIENNKLVVFSDLMNARNTALTIKPVYETKINGKTTKNEGVEIVVKVVDFVVNDVFAENSESGILTNFLGNSTMLKADFDADYCLDIFYRNENDVAIEKYSYTNENGEEITVSFDTTKRQLELSNIMLKIKALKEQISKSNYSWNIITKNSTGNLIYNNIKDSTNYSNFVVSVDADGYYNVYGKVISENRMMLKVNLSYENGLVTLKQNADNELTSEFVLNIKSNSSLDNPIPISTSEEFLTKMEDGGNYILLNDITLPASFGGIDAKILSFDGNNKTINIAGFSLSSANQTSLGLFNTIDENAIVKNVTINILPTLFYADEYHYGLNVNAQACENLNFGVLCGTNEGVITNCKIINNNYKLVNNENVYKEIYINVNAVEDSNINVGALVGENNGYITHSSVGDNNSNSRIAIMSKAVIGGLCAVNNNKIASSFVVNIAIYNNSKTKITAGFVATNSNNSQITTSYVQGYADKPNEVKTSLTDGGIFANGYVGGFVATNDGKIKDCYANLQITTNKRSSGFVYDNSNGNVETSISASTASNSTQSFRYFIGNNEENIVLNNQGVKYCYYIAGEDKNGGEGEYDEPANAISSFDDASFYEGFICDGSSSSVWEFNKNSMPKPVDANQKIVSERKLLNAANSKTTEKYEYIYINNDIGSINNPIIVSTTEQFFEALTSENNLYSYYYAGKVQKTQINYKHISVVKDLDLSKIIDKNNNEINTTNEVQKLQDIIFAGNLNGNGMLFENITITAKNDKVKYSSFGLFKQIGVEATYNSRGEIKNSYLDSDNCSVIKNVNFEIDGISATITRNVGTLSGEVINSKLYNINIYSNNNVSVEGNNIVGGVAGRISGNSFVKGVSSNLGVKATFENKTTNYEYNAPQSAKVYANASGIIQDDLNQNVNIVGGLFGVVDIYTTKIENFVQKAGTNSYYVDAKIVRSNDFVETNANIQFTTASGDIRIIGDVVGGMFGYVESGSKIYDARFVLNESNSQNLIANYAVGGICGINKGFITYSTVETGLTRQREIDKLDSYTTSYLFSNSENKAKFVGGLVGILKDGYLSYSYNKANIIATKSQFVGAAVGAFENAKMNYVYANAYLEAQKEVSENGLVTTQKGYAGFVGTITSFENQSFISHAVSILRNKETTADGFDIASMVGYNNADDASIVGEYSNNVNSITGGKEISEAKINGYEYQDYINQSSSTFSGYSSSSDENAHWVRTKDLDTYYRLSYNKKGAIKEIGSEDDLRNLTKNGTYTLTSDIYLTRVWDPISEFNGELSSAKRKDRKDGQSEYYIIYNLTINNKSKNVANDVGFFASLGEKAQINDITFVVGSNYKDPGDGSDPTETDTNWDNGTTRGIKIFNSNSTAHNLGVLSGKANGSTITNFTLKIADSAEDVIYTNLDVVGGVIGDATDVKIISSAGAENGNGVCLDNIKMKRDSNKKVSQNDGKDIYFGGVIGKANGCEIKNVNFNNQVKISNLQNIPNNNTYIGAVCGYSELCDISNVLVANEDKTQITLSHTTDYKSFGELESKIYCAVISGYAKGTSAKNINIEHTNVLIENNYTNLSEIYAGTIFGANNKLNNFPNDIQDVVIKSTTNLTINDSSTDFRNNNGSKINYIGGLCGYSEEGNIKNVNSALNLNFTSAEKTGSTFFGGIVGKNGEIDGGTTVAGSNISNVICKRTLTLRHKSQKVYAGGLCGYNLTTKVKSNNVENSLFIGSLKYFCNNLNFVGGIVGNNGDLKNGNQEDKENYQDCYFIEDLSLTPSRSVEYGTAISYAKFVKMIENKSILTDDFSAYKNDEDIVESAGETIKFVEGSIYNPIEINSKADFIASDEENSLKNGKYYLLNDNLDLTNENTISEINGNIIGNGHEIKVSKGFADKVNSDAILADLIFNLAGTGETYNNKEFVETSFIVAKNNSGVIYNCVVKGNITESSTKIAPVAIENHGFINVVTSLALIIAKGANASDAGVSGFVCENSGVIYNSLAVGTIEVINMGSNYSVYAKIKESNKISGFVLSNKDIITNCASGVTLPLMIKDADETDALNTTFKNSSSGTISNCVVDFYANGNYKEPSPSEGIVYTDNLNVEIVAKFSTNLWQKEVAGVIYGYRYPVLSIFKETSENGEENEFLKKIEEVLNTTETKNNKVYHKVNNFSSLRNVIDLLQNDENIENVNIKLENSFIGSVQKEEVDKQIYDTIYNSTICITKPFTLDGNNCVIYNYSLQNESKDDDAYLGLFWSNVDAKVATSGSNITINRNIIIENLALKNANIKINPIKQTGTDGANDEAIKNIYVGGFVAKASCGVRISGCYIDGKIECSEKTASKYDPDSTIVIGGIAGDLSEGGRIENCVSKLNIEADYLTASMECNEGIVNKSGYIAYVGGIAGNTSYVEINNNYVFGNVSISSVKELKMGGIAGKWANKSGSNNVMLGQVYYKGAYLGYFADSASDDKFFYNVNAIVGECDGTGSGNLYNEGITLTKDNKIASISNVQTIIDKANNITNNSFVSNTNIFEKPVYEILDDTNQLKVLNDNTTYIIPYSGTSNILFNENQKRDLTNTTIIFANPAKVSVTKNIFDTLTNCAISNLTICADNGLTTSALANKIETTKLYNITVENIYFSRTTGTSTQGENSAKDNHLTIGGVVDYAVSSMLFNVKVNKGRIEANFKGETSDAKTLSVGGIVGYGKQTLLSSCENSATITTSFDGITRNDDFIISTAGLMGQSTAGYIFGSTNSGLVYAKNLKDQKIVIQTAGITNTYSSGNVISFCKNSEKIKGVNTYKNQSVKNYVAGISAYDGSIDGSVGDTISYCYNSNNITAISSTTGSTNDVATGIGGASVYYSYFMGGVVSSSKIYTLTCSNAFYSYSLGSGYTAGQKGGSNLSLAGGDYSTSVGTDTILAGISDAEKDQRKEHWFVTISKNNTDLVVLPVADTTRTDDKGNKIPDWADTTLQSNFVRPTIRYFGEEQFKLPENNEEYQISTAFELWYWSKFVCGKENVDKDVALTNDIDMTGYTWQTPAKFDKTFNGNFHTITNLVIEKREDGNSQLWGFVGQNNGTIQSINFENASIKIETESEQIKIETESEQSDFAENVYVSIVAGINNGTIQSILVGQVGESNRTISIYSKTGTLQGGLEQLNLRVGVIAANNSGEGKIQDVEVINLSDSAIYSDIQITKPVTQFRPNNVLVELGGIVGLNEGSIDSAYYLSSVISKLTNSNMYGLTGISDDLAGDGSAQLAGELLYGLYSQAKQHVGQIVGQNNKGTIDNCYSPTGDEFKYIATQNLLSSIAIGKATSIAQGNVDQIKRIANFAKFGLVATIDTIKWIKLAKTAKNALSLGKAAGAGAKAALGPIGWIILCVDVATAASQYFINQASFESSFNHHGIGGMPGDALSISNSDNEIYIKQYWQGFENIEICSAVRSLEKMPYNKSFKNLSSSLVAPKQENGIYYVYNVNELAYALTKLNGATIELMDNIDMTTKVWDEEGENGLKTINKLTIIDNGFKIVYGSNTNFATKFTTAEYSSDLLKQNSKDANEYGKFESVSKNQNQVAMEKFEGVFEKVWKKEFANTHSEAEAESEYKNQGIITTLSSGQKLYKVDYAEQLEVIADAMATYTINKQSLHKGINFSGCTIEIRSDLTMPETMISLNQFIYDKDGTTKAPSFVVSDSNSNTIELDDEQSRYEAFAGTLKGYNHTITINKNQNLIYSSLGTIQDIVIDATKVKTISTSQNLGSLGVMINFGTMKNIKLKTAEKLTFEQKISFADSLETPSEKLIVSSNTNAVTQFGLFSAINDGKIINCSFNNEIINIKYSLDIDWESGLKEAIEDMKKQTDDETYSNLDYYNYTTRQLAWSINAGIISGANIGSINNVNIYKTEMRFILPEDQEIKYNIKNGENDQEITAKTLFMLNVGFISGRNEYSHEMATDKERLDLINIKIIGSKLITKNKFFGAVGLISGYSSLGFKKCKVLDSNININSNDASNVAKGSLCGSISPSIFSINKVVMQDNIYERQVEIFSAYIPTVAEIISSETNWFGETIEIKVGAKNQKLRICDDKGNDGDIYVSKISYGEGDGAQSIFAEFFYIYNNLGKAETQYNIPLAGFGTRAVATNYDNTTELTISLDNSSKNSTVLTLKAYIENNVNGTIIPETWFEGKPNVKLKLTLLDNSGKILKDDDGNEIYCYATDGTEVYISDGKSIKDFVKLALVDIDSGEVIEKLSGLENQTITINGVKFVGDISYATSATEVINDGKVVGLKLVVTYSNLSYNVNYNEKQTLKQFFSDKHGFTITDSSGTALVDGDLGMTIDESFNDKRYKANYSFTKDGKTYTINGINLIFNQL